MGKQSASTHIFHQENTRILSNIAAIRTVNPQEAQRHWNFWHSYLIKGCLHGDSCVRRFRNGSCNVGSRMSQRYLVSGAIQNIILWGTLWMMSAYTCSSPWPHHWPVLDAVLPKVISFQKPMQPTCTCKSGNGARSDRKAVIVGHLFVIFLTTYFRVLQDWGIYTFWGRRLLHISIWWFRWPSITYFNKLWSLWLLAMGHWDKRELHESAASVAGATLMPLTNSNSDPRHFWSKAWFAERHTIIHCSNFHFLGNYAVCYVKHRYVAITFGCCYSHVCWQ